MISKFVSRSLRILSSVRIKNYEEEEEEEEERKKERKKEKKGEKGGKKRKKERKKEKERKKHQPTTKFSIRYIWGEPLTHAALQPFAMGSAGALSMPLVVDVMECLVQSISTNFFQNSEVHYKCLNIYCL